MIRIKKNVRRYKMENFRAGLVRQPTADLSRIKWVGVTFARMLFDLGVDTVEKSAKSDQVELHAMINRLNKEKSIYKGQIGLNDIRIFVNAAKEIPVEIEY